MEAIFIPSDSEGRFLSQAVLLWRIWLFICVYKSFFCLFISAFLNMNTNATTRGDAQVSLHISHIKFNSYKSLQSVHSLSTLHYHRPMWSWMSSRATAGRRQAAGWATRRTLTRPQENGVPLMSPISPSRVWSSSARPWAQVTSEP